VLVRGKNLILKIADYRTLDIGDLKVNLELLAGRNEAYTFFWNM
jgi:hypothetical protein